MDKGSTVALAVLVGVIGVLIGVAALVKRSNDREREAFEQSLDDPSVPDKINDDNRVKANQEKAEDDGIGAQRLRFSAVLAPTGEGELTTVGEALAFDAAKNMFVNCFNRCPLPGLTMHPDKTNPVLNRAMDACDTKCRNYMNQQIEQGYFDSLLKNQKPLDKPVRVLAPKSG